MPRRVWHAIVLATVVLLTLPLASLAAPQRPPAPKTYIVKRGDTLADIAWKLGMSAGALGRANGIDNFNHIYPGQVLTIPGQSGEKIVEKTPAEKAAAAVQETAAAEKSIATDKAGADKAVADAPKTAGEGDTMPGADGEWACLEPPASDNTTRNTSEKVGDKWIEVDLSLQRLAACEGTDVVLNVLVSTGTEEHPTPTGSFKILDRVRFEDMDGPGYYLEDVPNVMLFKRRGYALHGTYWHDNFGHPMSHGCINLTIEDSAWVYDWAPNGTPVIVHD